MSPERNHELHSSSASSPTSNTKTQQTTLKPPPTVLASSSKARYPSSYSFRPPPYQPRNPNTENSPGSTTCPTPSPSQPPADPQDPSLVKHLASSSILRSNRHPTVPPPGTPTMNPCARSSPPSSSPATAPELSRPCASCKGPRGSGSGWETYRYRVLRAVVRSECWERKTDRQKMEEAGRENQRHRATATKKKAPLFAVCNQHTKHDFQ